MGLRVAQRLKATEVPPGAGVASRLRGRDISVTEKQNIEMTKN
jgi:hypothetical protein